MSTSQTLSRGLTALEFIALAESAPTIDDVAAHLGVHRSIAYRIVRTLEEHHLTDRDDAGRCVAGLRLAALGRFARPSLQSLAVSELAKVADELSTTCFLVVRDGDEALTVESLEPTNTMFHLTYKPGTRHPIDRGAPGLAVLAGHHPRSNERPEVTATREQGWAMTTGEVVDGLTSIAVPLTGVDASIAAVFLDTAGVNHRRIIDHLTAAAASIISGLDGRPNGATTVA